MYNATKLKYFKNRYENDETFRNKQLEYMKVKVICTDCGKSISRSNMVKHKSTKWHQRLIQEKVNKLNEVKIQQEINRLKNIIEQLKATHNTDQYENVLLDV